MVYDTQLAERIRSIISADEEVADVLAEKEMFGGLAFLVAGNLAVAARGSGMLLRTDPHTGEGLVDGVHIVPMEKRGHGMHGWLQLDPAVLGADEDLERYVRMGVAYARSLEDE